MVPKLRRALALALLASGLLLARTGGTDQPPLQPLDLDRGATGLGLALRRVGTTGRVLYVTAHPDDEHNGVLVNLSRGRGVHTALLTLTRGEGGQNAIGPELFEALGVLRTGELMALHRYDGVDQYFGRAYEFGYSFSVEETFARWGREDTLGDVVRVMRSFRPDVVLTLPPQGHGGGQHHQAAGQLALEAFRAAADPKRFPEQLRDGLRPWQARKIYAGGVGGFLADTPSGQRVRVPTGVYDPLLGMSWEQLGSRARAMHRCQGARQLLAPFGPAEGDYVLLDSEPKVAAAEEDILDGVDTGYAGLGRFVLDAGIASALAALQPRATAARAAFDPASPENAVPALSALLQEVRRIRTSALDPALLKAPPSVEVNAGGRLELADRLAEEETDIVHALVLAQGVVVEPLADAGLVTPGQTFSVSVALSNAARRPFEAEAVTIEAPGGWTVEPREGSAGEVPPGITRTLRFAVKAAADARISQPYWRKMKDHDRNELLVPVDGTLPWSPPDLVARLGLHIGGAGCALRVPVAWRYEGPLAGGEKRDVVQVVPELAVRISPEILPLPLGSARRPIELHAFARSNGPGPGEAQLRLEVPPGWSVQPASVPLRFAQAGEELGGRFVVTPGATVSPGLHTVRAVASREDRESGSAVQVVEYPHVERRQLLRPAETHVLALDVRTPPGLAVGYVMGSGDAIADAIRELGLPLTLLGAEDLAFADLGRFSTIVTGIRAYETRPDLRSAQGRLMRWVEAGGHLVVQYNRDAFNGTAPNAPPPKDATSPYVPYPAVVTPERITDETTAVRALVPDAALLTTPNRIGPADWDGWVQERGIQLLAARDPRYQDLLAATDPFPENPGEKRGLLVDAAVGQGTWTYVGLVLFREVPAGVPGAWRLLANLVSRPRR
ncbi:MAG TPA: PIG-L family deacetylase [Vicinamibacteria bacterium]|nr:PIG-L family deacetylase [Vicinamibacteria bacterium]